MDTSPAAKQTKCKNPNTGIGPVRPSRTPDLYKHSSCCSAIEVANHFIVLTKANTHFKLTPLLLEKMVILANIYCFKQGDFQLIDEQISEDKYGEFFRSLRNYLSYYSSDEVISECFSNLSPENDYLAKKELGIDCVFPKLEEHSPYLDVVYNYVSERKIVWSDLSARMTHHVDVLVTDRERRSNG